eukprot:m.148051 g.148051  ORF g.148051 m.148051 type:complete len:377 (+) comp17304_c0_seq3:157-1287(+)
MDDGVVAAVGETVARDALAADFAVSLFAAALQSYRVDTVLRPFPRRPTRTSSLSATEPPGSDGEGLVQGEDVLLDSDGDSHQTGETHPLTSRASREQTGTGQGPHRTHADYERLRQSLDRVPRLVALRRAPGNGTTATSTIPPPALQHLARDCPGAVQLLDWILHPRGFTITTASPAMFDAILRQAGCEEAYGVRPDFIFQLNYDIAEGPGNGSTVFDTLAPQHGTMVAYHGSALENFYSIVRLGFCAHLNKTSLYGKGTYLSTDLRVCMDFTKPGRSWANSALGSRLTCVAVCDVVKHPDVKLPGRIADDPESTGLGNHVKVPDKCKCSKEASGGLEKELTPSTPLRILEVQPMASHQTSTTMPSHQTLPRVVYV